jgi:uncharacterized protein (TIGR03435 family)
MIRSGSMVLLASALFAQSAPPVRSFEVASVKIHHGPTPRIGISTSGRRLTADAVNMWLLIMYAYNIRNFRIFGAEPLMRDDNARWDILAEAEGDSVPAVDEFRHMLQLLLAERFQLKVHRETREMPVYALVVGKSGPRFKESDPDADPTQHFSLKGRDNFVTMPKATMDELANAVSNAMPGRPVVDNTGLTGTYNIRLTYTANTRANRDSEPDLSDVSVFQAVEEQLGLKLEARKETVEILVVDRVEKPSGNY